MLGVSILLTLAQVQAAEKKADVSFDRLLNAEQEPGQWLIHGRTFFEQRFSPLKQITQENINKLGLDWHFDINTDRGLEGTPIVVDGVMYAAGAWSIVYALDARNGRLLWSYDPKIAADAASIQCCDIVDRGIAVYKDRVYVAAFDGRLIALNAGDGTPIWEVNTVTDDWPYTITGAPRIVRDKIVIGNSGADLGVRGYVSAYDADSGKLSWRFYTVPGNPAKGFENPAMEMAAKTWKGEWWQYGGGGTVWDSISYDPALDLVYIGVGNGSPWPQDIRSPGGGDNLFLSSIVALKASSGEYVWHYQTTPGETWDYTATQHMILADIEVDGRLRKVIMQAPKNGFFYVLDRANGELLRADAYAKVNWATHVDMKTGRPVETADARYGLTPKFTLPSGMGAHNWHPMSYSPNTGLVYIPAQEIPGMFSQKADFVFSKGSTNLGISLANVAPPEDEATLKEVLSTVHGYLIGWDPVSGKAKWSHEQTSPVNGGVLTTASDLLFQGRGDGKFAAHNAVNGKELWTQEAQTGLIAPPITYEIDGVQYVSIMAGWGGGFSLAFGPLAAQLKVRNVSRILTYSLDGKDKLPPLPVLNVQADSQTLPAGTDPDHIETGKNIYHENCMVCHGAGAIGGGTLPDLRFSSTKTFESWKTIVLKGALRSGGMPAFDKLISSEELEKIRLYIIKRANDFATSNLTNN
ncbi:MAG: PQQ-dependent dehydrogenase, methanol/ethanol family [Gammaproteobacteria bacterium]|nr:PQQ-dependent dehydrogenase, methanol/ethanol family [Gammaproteobacteria bacterium]